jgi:O-antigen ligase
MTTAVSARPVAIGVRPVSNAALGRILWGLCAILAVVFLNKSGSGPIWVCSTLILAAATVLTWREPLRALVVLPCVFMIGPIARLPLGSSLSLHIGDAYLVVMALALLLKHGLSRRVWLGDYRVSIFATLFFVMLSWLFAMDPVSATPTIIGIGEMMLVYFMTINLVKSREDVRSVIDGWAYGMTIASVLLIVSYSRGETLLIGIAPGQANSFRSTTSLFRATYFVTSFIYPLTAVVLSLLVDVAVSGHRTRWQRVGLFALLVVNLIAVALTGTVTAFGGIGILAICLILWLLRSRRERSGALFLLIAATLAGVGITAALYQLLPVEQIQLLVARPSSGESLRERIIVWRNVINVITNHARVLLIGVGPDLSVRAALPILQSSFNGGGREPWAVDNDYLYLLLNYGLFVFVLIASIIVRAQVALTRLLWRKTDPVVLDLWLWLACLWVMSVTQQFAVSKPTAIMVQVIAMTIVLKRVRFQPDAVSVQA